jgi:predicted P-loop ATPase
MSALTTHTFGNQRKGKRKETNKKKLQQAIESRERERARSLEEDKSRTP